MPTAFDALLDAEPSDSDGDDDEKDAALRLSYREVFTRILQSPEQFAAFIKTLTTADQQALLFVCEVSEGSLFPNAPIFCGDATDNQPAILTGVYFTLRSSSCKTVG